MKRRSENHKMAMAELKPNDSYDRAVADARDLEFVKVGKQFEYDQVYDETLQGPSTESVASLVEDAPGYNGTVFAYGQTGSGKTYSTMGLPPIQRIGASSRSASHVAS